MTGLRNWLPASIVLAGLMVLLGADQPRPRDGDLRVGASAPDFTVKDMSGKKTVKLVDLRGKPVVLIFGSCT
jgi:cytochrome oxidase Cu insertion factor (SCO1/SenC/PrrC family)